MQRSRGSEYLSVLDNDRLIELFLPLPPSWEERIRLWLGSLNESGICMTFQSVYV